MRILLCGQKSFGRSILKLLLRRGDDVAAVCCPGGNDKLNSLRWGEGLPWIESGALSARACPPGLDLIIAAHSHDFIGKKTRAKARLGAVGYHPSLLPLHRGRDAIRWAIKMGDKVTGGSVYWLSNTVDGGHVGAQDWCFIRPDDDPLSLWIRELAPMGERLFGKTLEQLDRGVCVRKAQDPSLATWEPSMEGQPIHRPDLEALPMHAGAHDLYYEAEA